MQRRSVFVCLLALLMTVLVASASITSSERSATLNVLREFADEYDVLKHVWTGSDYCSWPHVTCDANDDVHVGLSGAGLEGNLPDVKKNWGPHSRVVSIDLSHNPDLDNDFKRDFRYLTNLRSLDLSYTRLRGSIPNEWGALRNLETVNIHHTRACRSLPTWNNMPKLRHVDFSYNNFHGPLLGSWASLRGLQSVNLAGNSFCGCAPESWARHAVLQSAVSGLAAGSPRTCARNSCSNSNTCPKTVNADGDFHGSHTPSTGTPRPTTVAPQTTSRPTTAAPTAAPTTAPTVPTVPTVPAVPPTKDATLQFLMQFRWSFPDVLSSWTGTAYCSWQGVSCVGNEVRVSLRNANLAGTLPTMPRGINGAAVRVVSIDMSRNSGLTGNFPDSWAALKQLRVLDLSDTALFGDIPNSWNGMVSLEEVYIRNTRACRNMPAWGSSMARLRIVDFSQNRLTGRMMGSWAFMPSLQSVDISGNSFCGCVPNTWAHVSVLMNAASVYPAAIENTCGFLNKCTGTSSMCNVA